MRKRFLRALPVSREVLERFPHAFTIAEAPGKGPDLALTYEEQAEGALPNGTRVVKVRTRPTDAHKIGDKATVRGSIRTPEGDYGYMLEWDDMPKVHVLCTGDVIEPDAAC